jgi:hypothetical protein
MEPWGKMKKYHKRQLVRYVNKHEELKKNGRNLSTI